MDLMTALRAAPVFGRTVKLTVKAFRPIVVVLRSTNMSASSVIVHPQFSPNATILDGPPAAGTS
jgi:hypothetical protein